MSMHLIGLGTAVPEFTVSQSESVEAARNFFTVDESTARILPILYRKSGVSKRHSVILRSDEGPVFDRQTFFQPHQGEWDRGPTTGRRMEQYERSAGELATRASLDALRSARLDAKAITHLITVSCSGFHAPGFDIDLIERLRLSPEVSRTHVGFMGCHAAMNALRIAEAFAASDARARVLVCATELCTLHCQYGWNPDNVLTNALFADGSAAVVCAAEGGDSLWSYRRSGSILIPNSREAMTWRIGDHGFEMTLSARVPELIAKHLKPWLVEWLDREGLRLRDVRSWALHPGGPRILQAVGETLDLPPGALDASRAVLSEFGNMSSPTILFVLRKLRETGAEGPCVALGFGPGLVAEAMLLN